MGRRGWFPPFLSISLPPAHPHFNPQFRGMELISLPPSMPPGQRASLEHSHLSHAPSLTSFSGFLLPSGKSPNSLGWLTKPSGPGPFLPLQDHFLLHFSPLSPHLDLPPPPVPRSWPFPVPNAFSFWVFEPAFFTSAGPQPETFSPLRFAWLTPTNLKKSWST